MQSLINVFKDLFDAANIPNWDQPLTITETISSNYSADHNLAFPLSKSTCLLLYLYSMELGHPPLYCELNRAAINMDLTLLAQLGPYIQALSAITTHAERNRDRDDIVQMSGHLFGKAPMNMAGSYMLWKGAMMSSDDIAQFSSKVGQRVRLPGYFECTRSLPVALGHVFKAQKQPNGQETQATIFAITH